jgi:hypothetical protein
MRSVACWVSSGVTWGVALGLDELGVAKNLLDDADADALFEQERRRSVPSVMDPCLPDSGFLVEGMPVLPVISGVDRRTGRRAED